MNTSRETSSETFTLKNDNIVPFKNKEDYTDQTVAENISSDDSTVKNSTKSSGGNSWIDVINAYRNFMGLFDSSSEKRYHSSEEEIEKNQSQGDDDMDKILEKYIDKMDRDQSDFKHEMRERDSRSEERQRELEKRLAKATEESEKRNQESAKRIEEALLRMESSLEKSESRIESKLSDMESKIEKSENRIESFMREYRYFSIANFVAIAALVIGTMIGLYQIFQATIG